MGNTRDFCKPLPRNELTDFFKEIGDVTIPEIDAKLDFNKCPHKCGVLSVINNECKCHSEDYQEKKVEDIDYEDVTYKRIE